MKKLIVLVLMAFISACAQPVLGHAKYKIKVNSIIDAASASAFVKKIKDNYDGIIDSKQLQININSPGGGVESGIAIIETITHLQSRGVAVTTICQNMCASMGGFIFAAGDFRFMSKTSRLMIHRIYYSNHMDIWNDDLKTGTDVLMQPLYEKTILGKEIWDAQMALGDVFMGPTEAQLIHLSNGTIPLEMDDIEVL